MEVTRPLGRTNRLAYENVLIPQYLRGHREIELVHFMENACPPLVPRRMRVVTTIHDTFALSPQRRSLAGEYQRQGVVRALTRSDHIVTVSRYSAQCISERTTSAISPIYCGVSVERVHKPRDGILLLAAPDVRKNWQFGVAVVRELQQMRRNGARLTVIVSRAGLEGEVRRATRGLDSVYLVEPDDASYLEALGNARLLLFPSLNEGFGAPIVEAMASGALVAAFPVGAIPEVAGDGYIKLQDHDPRHVARQLDRILDDGEMQRTLVTKGVNRSGMFTWAGAASAMIDVYLNTLSGGA